LIAKCSNVTDVDVAGKAGLLECVLDFEASKLGQLLVEQFNSDFFDVLGAFSGEA
jgi:hypothetical protein